MVAVNGERRHRRPGNGRLCSLILTPPSQWGIELELELIQSHMAQKPMLRGEVGCACVAREVSVERGGMGSDLNSSSRGFFFIRFSFLRGIDQATRVQGQCLHSV